MRNITLSEIAAWINAEYNGDAIISGIKVDARLVVAGDMFVCLKGAKVDGHNFGQDAIDNGATALLVDHYLDLPIAQILVEDTLVSLIELAKAYRSQLQAFFIGITGSNGKTSTKDMLKSILSLEGKTHATIDNQNTEIGTCLNLFLMDFDTKYGVFEMGLDRAGEISAMVDIVKPDAALVMSIAPTHIVNFKDEKHIAKEKLEIFKFTDKKRCYYQGDFVLLRSLDRGYRSFGFAESNEFVASDVVLKNNGVNFKVNNIAYECNLLGAHQASNGAGVIGLLQDMGVRDVSIREGLKNISLTSLRTEIIEYKKSLILLDAYKSNPASTTYALEILQNYEYAGRKGKAVILSDMVELGSFSQKSHLDILHKLDKSSINTVVLLGPEFKKALESVNLDGKEVISIDEFENLEPIANELFNKPCMILIKGSRSYALERLLKED